MPIMHHSSLSFSYFMQNTHINQPTAPTSTRNTTSTKMVGCSSKRSEGLKEKTKLRERHRRAITTNIFHGLRKFGGYPLPPRADINQLLRELAKEAGWVVHPDGTTYRHKLLNPCPTCGSFSNAMPSATITSTIIPGPGITSGGEFSTTSSPCHINPKLMMIGSNTNDACTTTHFYGNNGSSANDGGTPLPLYIYTGLTDGIHHPNTTTATLDKVPTEGVRMQQQGARIRESRASNSNTPVGSPLHTLY